MHAGYRYLLLREKQKRRRKDLLPRRTWDGTMGCGTVSRSLRHECMGTHGTSYFYLCTGLRSGMDSCRTCNRLHYKLAAWSTETEKILDCSKRLNHHSAVSDQQIPVQITCTAGDMCNCVFGCIHYLCGIKRKGMRYPFPHCNRNGSTDCHVSCSSCHRRLYLPRRLLGCMLDRFFPGHARTWFYVYSTDFCSIYAWYIIYVITPGRLLKSILKLAGYRVRTGMGTWLLWYATYHHQIHVHQITEGFEKISKNRNHMDSAYCIFCNLNRSNRKTFPWLWRINQWKLSCFHPDSKKDFPGCYIRYTALSSACRFHEYRRQPAACCFICFLERCVQACHQKR